MYGCESWIVKKAECWRIDAFLFVCLFTVWATREAHALFSSVQSLSRVRLFVTPWIAVYQASLSITNSRSSLKLMFIESVMPSSHLILCHPLLLLPPIPPSIRVFSNESARRMRWPKYWSFSFRISHSKEHPGLIPLWFQSWGTIFYKSCEFEYIQI